MSFCTRCGRPLTEGSAFCTACGSPSAQVEAIAPLQAAAPPPFPQPTLVQPPLKKGGHTLLFTIVGVILFALVAGAAGLVYAGYRVKQKATALMDDATSTANTSAGDVKNIDGKSNAGPPVADWTTHRDDDVDKGLDAIGNLADRMGASAAPTDPYDDLEVVKKNDPQPAVCPSAKTLAPVDVVRPTAGRIPLREGLIVTSTWGRTPGDVDEANAISIQPEALKVTSGGLTFANDEDTKGQIESSEGSVCAADLKTSHAYTTGFSVDRPKVLPGVTRQILSAAAFQELKTTGTVSLRYLVLIKTPDGEGYYKHWQQGELKRVEPGDMPYSVIVNDAITTLPVIHAQGILIAEGKAANKDSKYAINRPTTLDLKVFDDPLNPLVMFFKFEGDAFRIEVTKIEFPNHEKKIEQELSKNKKAVVYGIYFDFNSDKIKAESKQVLDEIAAALKDNPDWKLTVDGHTDNIGGDTYNLDLSKRRSAAVRQALVAQYHVNPDRLSSTGSGVAGAIDTNDTIIGRSHNRRVELTRQ